MFAKNLGNSKKVTITLKTAVNAEKTSSKKGPKGLKGRKGRTSRENVLLSFWSFMSLKSFGLKTASEFNGRF